MKRPGILPELGGKITISHPLSTFNIIYRRPISANHSYQRLVWECHSKFLESMAVWRGIKAPQPTKSDRTPCSSLQCSGFGVQRQLQIKVALAVASISPSTGDSPKNSTCPEQSPSSTEGGLTISQPRQNISHTTSLLHQQVT